MWPGTHSRLHASSRREHERQHRVPQGVLRGVGRLPGGQRLDASDCVEAHLRTSRPSVGAGSRGPDGSAG